MKEDHPKLFMAMLGCRPPGRITEQHDMFFAIATRIEELVPAMKACWPEAKGRIHVDAWREVTWVDGFSIEVVPTAHLSLSPVVTNPTPQRLFFINLGGYKAGEFDEFHYKMLIVAETKSEAITKAKQSAFYKHTGFKGAASHVDEKYGLDVDDMVEIQDLLPASIKAQYRLTITPSVTSNGQPATDTIHLGYMPLYRLNRSS